MNRKRPRLIVRRWMRRLSLDSRRQWTRRLAFWAGGLLVGLMAIVFAWAADRAGGSFRAVTTLHPWAALLIAPAGLALSAWLTRRAFPGAQGSGVPQVIASLETQDAGLSDRVLSLRIGAGKVVLTLLGLASGASIGREGPTVQIGASIMLSLGRWLGVERQETRRALMLAGGAAGVSAAFNTPLAGIVFAIEELAHSFEQRTSGNVLTAVILAGATTLALVGNYTYFGVTSTVLPLGPGVISVVVCGLAGGALGGLFSRMLVAAASGMSGALGRFAGRRPVLFAGCCGLVLALIGLATAGATYGTGYDEARRLLAGPSALPGWFFTAKLVATVVSYASGIPGGIFAPSLAVGAGLGDTLAHVLPAARPAVLLLCMAAYFSGVVQAPLTATVIVMEMVDNQGLTVPFLAVSLLAYGVSRLICRRPLYGALARRFLRAQHGARVVAEAVPAIPLVEHNS